MKFKDLFEGDVLKGMFRSKHHDELVNLGFNYSEAQSSGSTAGFISKKKIPVKHMQEWAASKGYKAEQHGMKGHYSYRGKGGPYADEIFSFSSHPNDPDHVQLAHHRYNVDKS